MNRARPNAFRQIVETQHHFLMIEASMTELESVSLNARLKDRMRKIVVRMNRLIEAKPMARHAAQATRAPITRKTHH